MTKRNMNEWIQSLKSTSKKKPLPVLSFPCVSLLHRGIDIASIKAERDADHPEGIQDGGEHHEEGQSVGNHHGAESTHAGGLGVLLAVHDKQGVEGEQRRGHVHGGVRHAEGGLGQLGGDAEHHEHGHEDGGKDGPLGSGRSDEDVQHTGKQDDAEQRHARG